MEDGLMEGRNENAALSISSISCCHAAGDSLVSRKERARRGLHSSSDLKALLQQPRDHAISSQVKITGGLETRGCDGGKCARIPG